MLIEVMLILYLDLGGQSEVLLPSEVRMLCTKFKLGKHAKILKLVMHIYTDCCSASKPIDFKT